MEGRGGGLMVKDGGGGGSRLRRRTEARVMGGELGWRWERGRGTKSGKVAGKGKIRIAEKSGHFVNVTVAVPAASTLLQLLNHPFQRHTARRFQQNRITLT